MTELPQFKYNPNALTLGIIKKKSISCSSCGRRRSHAYEGPFHSSLRVQALCPWCISDGTAAAKFKGVYQDPALCEPVRREEYIHELTTRTPGYPGWQKEHWLSHCGDFCALKAFVVWDDIKSLRAELGPDLEQIKASFEFSQEELEQNFAHGGSIQGYLFQCLHCAVHRLAVDYH